MFPSPALAEDWGTQPHPGWGHGWRDFRTSPRQGLTAGIRSAAGLAQVHASRLDVALMPAAMADHDGHRWLERGRTGAPGARGVVLPAPLAPTRVSHVASLGVGRAVPAAPPSEL